MSDSNVLLAESRALLARAIPYLRGPDALDEQAEVLEDGSGIRLSSSGRFYPFENGVLDFLGDGLRPTITQRALDTHLSSWFYDRLRNTLLRLVGSPRFPAEVDQTQADLRVGPGDTVIDLACGQGNFTVEWARRAGAEGLVLGVDISTAMLRRAAARVRAAGLSNVLFIRGDALRLPLASRSVSRVNCSGGFHQFPDLSKGLREIARITTAGARLTACMFASAGDRLSGVQERLKRAFSFHVVPLAWLERELEALGFTEFSWSIPGRGFAYVAAQRVPPDPAGQGRKALDDHSEVASGLEDRRPDTT